MMYKIDRIHGHEYSTRVKKESGRSPDLGLTYTLNEQPMIALYVHVYVYRIVSTSCNIVRT